MLLHFLIDTVCPPILAYLECAVILAYFIPLAPRLAHDQVVAKEATGDAFDIIPTEAIWYDRVRDKLYIYCISGV